MQLGQARHSGQQKGQLRNVEQIVVHVQTDHAKRGELGQFVWVDRIQADQMNGVGGQNVRLQKIAAQLGYAGKDSLIVLTELAYEQGPHVRIRSIVGEFASAVGCDQ